VWLPVMSGGRGNESSSTLAMDDRYGRDEPDDNVAGSVVKNDALSNELVRE
jgi:hypothetical protein